MKSTLVKETIQKTQLEKNPSPAESDTKKIVIKTVLLTSFVFVGAIGFFALGYVFSQYPKTSMNVHKPSLVPTNKPTGLFQPSPNKTAKPQGFDEGDETLGTDPAYIAAMNKVPETTTYTSPFGYTINLMKGWRKIDKLSFDDVNGKSEAFSPYTDDQIENMLTTDPYNPNYYLEVEVRENPQNISLSEWTTNSKHAPQAVGQESYDTVVGGIPAKKILGNQGTGYYDYYISANGKIYNLGYFYTTEKQWKSPPEMSIDIFQTMIESFIPTK